MKTKHKHTAYKQSYLAYNEAEGKPKKVDRKALRNAKRGVE